MVGLYIHIPFCRSKCTYCDFYSLPRMAKADAVVDGLVEEFKARRSEIDEEFATIYIGGGTPSSLSPEQLRRLVSNLPVQSTREFTIEANPDDINANSVRQWVDMGINRVSIGVQTLCDPVLKSIGRRHSAQQAIDAIHCLNDNGISNISADLIYGLPGVYQQQWERDLDTVLSLPITHLSAY